MDAFGQPHAILHMLLTLVTDPVPIGPGLFFLFWFSVPVSNPKKTETYQFPFVSKGIRSFSGIVILTHFSFDSYKMAVRNPNFKLEKIKHLLCTTFSPAILADCIFTSM